MAHHQYPPRQQPDHRQPQHDSSGAGPAAKTQKLERALRDVNTEAVRIQYCSRMMREQFVTRDDVGVATRVWARAFKYGTPPKLLPLLYVASDLLQTTASTTRADYVQAYSRPLVDAFVFSMTCLPESRAQLRRLWTVWTERRVMPEPLLADMKARADAEVVRAQAAGEVQARHFAASHQQSQPQHAQQPSDAHKRKRPPTPPSASRPPSRSGLHSPRSPLMSPRPGSSSGRPQQQQQQPGRKAGPVMSLETRQRLVAEEISSSL
jgi:hypothetical protein